jgi:hypothetical protein
MSGQFYEDGPLIALLRSPHLHNLTTLDLTFNQTTDATVETIAASPHFSRLTCLNLTDAAMTDGGGKALASSPYLTRLRLLRLAGRKYYQADQQPRMGPEGLGALAASPNLTGLEKLDLDRRLTDSDAALAAFVAAPCLRGLRSLRLEGNAITERGLRSLASVAAGHLRKLALSDNPIGPEGAAMLASCPLLGTLERLTLARCGLGPGGAQALATSPHLAKLNWLDLAYNQIGDEGAQSLVDSPHLPSGLRIRLPNPRMSKRVLAALAKRFAAIHSV